MTAHLTIHHLLWRMKHVFPHSHIVTIQPDNTYTYGDIADRVFSVAHGLSTTVGLTSGDVVTVFAWNTREHFELLLAVPLAGGIVNSINLRLDPTHMTELASRRTPRAVVIGADVLADPHIGPTVLATAQQAHRSGAHIIVIGSGQDAHPLPQAHHYESLVRSTGKDWVPPATDENTAAYLFNTSGTTGAPKTYEVTHRAALLHCLSQATVDAAGLSRSDRVLPLAPFFHVNGWGLPLTCALTGASLVLSGRNISPDYLTQVMNDQQVTVAAAVPTVWYTIAEAITAGKADTPTHLREIVTGGDVLHESLYHTLTETCDARIAVSWGMTETLACSTYERDKPYAHAGTPIPLVELETTGNPGRLKVRGPFVVGQPQDDNGWHTTSDIATFDTSTGLVLRDRAKDLIKSGGEWIIPGELERHLCTHPAVSAAAVVAVSDPRWVQRPHAFIVLASNSANHRHNLTDDLLDELTDHLTGTFPRWWVPDTFDIIDQLPHTTLGKIDKQALRHCAQSARTQSTHTKGHVHA